MLSAADLAGMREVLTESLPDTCTLIGWTNAPDGAGGTTRTPANTTVACRVSPLATAGRDFEAVASDRITSSVPWVGTFPAGTVILPSGRFVHNGHTFEVIAPSSGRSLEIDVRVIARLVS